MPSVGIPWLDHCCGCLVTESTNVIIKKKLQRLFLCFQSYPNFCQYCELKLLVGVAFGFWWQSENVIYWIWDVATHLCLDLLLIFTLYCIVYMLTYFSFLTMRLTFIALTLLQYILVVCYLSYMSVLTWNPLNEDCSDYFTWKTLNKPCLLAL